MEDEKGAETDVAYWLASARGADAAAARLDFVDGHPAERIEGEDTAS
jgi:hypothetical protein